MNPQSRPRKGMGRVLALSSAVFYSTRSILVRTGLEGGVGVRELVALRMLFTAALFFAAERWKGGARGGMRRLLANPRMLAGGLFFSVSVICSFYSVPLIGVAMTAIITYSHPLFVALFSGLFLGKRLGLKRGAAMFTAYIGCGLIVAPEMGAGPGSTSWVGACLALGTAASYACYQLLTEHLSREHSTVRIGAATAYIALVPSLLLWHLDPPTVGLFALSIGAAMGLFSTFLPIFLLISAIERLGAVSTSLYSMASPLSAVLLAYLIFDERLLPVQLAGACVVLCATAALLWIRES